MRYLKVVHFTLIQGPIPFNIFLFDLFISVSDKDITSYADGTIPYKTGLNYVYVIHKITRKTCFDLVQQQ